MADFNYSTLIRQSIADFDSIFGALVTKKVKHSDGAELSVATHRDSGLISTATYADLIKAQLFKIDGLTSNELGQGVVIANKVGATQAGLTPTISAITDSTDYKVSMKIPVAGYYDTTSTIETSIETQKLVISTTTATLSGGKYVKKVNISSEDLISEVEVAAGSVDAVWSTAKTEYVDTSSYTSDFTITSSKITGLKTTEDNLASTADYVAIDVSAAVNRTGKVTVTPVAQVVEGYVTADDVDLGKFEKEFNSNITFVENSGSTQIFIPKGSISIDDTSLDGVTTSITSTDSQVKFVGANAGGYEISASVAAADGGAINLKGSVVPGYVEQAADGKSVDLGSVTLNTGKTYIQAGSFDASVAIAGTTESPVLDIDSNTGVELDDNSKYKITLKAEGSATGTVSEGYTKGGSYTASVSETKVVSVKAGSVTINPNASVSVADTGSITGAASGYSITVTPVVDLTKRSVTEGYIETEAVVDGTPVITPTTLTIAQGSVAINNGLSTTFVEYASDGKGEALKDGKAVDIFLSAAPSNRDYYTITSSASKGTFVAGYLKSADEVSIGAVSTKYLPKADLKVSEVDGALVVNVEQGGYLPSGLLSASDLTESTISNAVIGVTKDTGSSDIFSTNSSTDAYVLNIKKGAVTTAGYISENAGSISGTYYVRKGYASATTTVNTLTSDGVTKKTGEGATGYQVAVKGTVSTALSTDALGGYVTVEDLKINGAKVTNGAAATTNVDKTVDINAATLKAATGANALKVSVTKDSAVELAAEGADGYTFTPHVEGTVGITANTAGYISDEVHSISFADTGIATGNRTALKIKKGTGVIDNTVVFTNSVAATDNFANTVSGSYTISVAGNVTASATLDTGYYAEGNVAIEETKTIAGTSLPVAHGKVDGSVSATLDLSAPVATGSTVAGQSIKFLEEGASSEVAYVEVKADVASIVNTITVTEGYTKQADVTASQALSNKDSVAISKKIALVNLGTDTAKVDGKDTTVYTMTVGQTSAQELSVAAQYAGEIFDETKEKYSSFDTKVTLSQHAMGSSVVAELQSLAARLNGSLVR